jgi:hypothetical protein
MREVVRSIRIRWTDVGLGERVTRSMNPGRPNPLTQRTFRERGLVARQGLIDPCPSDTRCNGVQSSTLLPGCRLEARAPDLGSGMIGGSSPLIPTTTLEL